MHVYAKKKVYLLYILVTIFIKNSVCQLFYCVGTWEMVSLFCTIHAHLTVLVEERALSSFLLSNTVKMYKCTDVLCTCKLYFSCFWRTPVLYSTVLFQRFYWICTVCFQMKKIYIFVSGPPYIHVHVYRLSPKKITIRFSASIAFKIVNQSEYALGL